MNMLSEKQKRIIQLLIIFAGILVGGVFLSPIFHDKGNGSKLLGGFIGFLISVVIFPETLKELFEQPSEKRMDRIMEEHQLGFYRFLTHPTQIPLSLSMLLFVVFLILAFLFDFLKINIDPSILQGGLLVIAFLWGLSGFLMIIRNEYIDQRGRRYRGFWAILNGIVFLLMGWGSLLFILLAKIFNWK